MTVENQKISPENQTNFQQVKYTQKQKDFDDVLKMFEKLLPSEQKSFLENLTSRDPKFSELYEQLNTYVWSEIMKIDEISQNITLKTIIEKPKQKPIETQEQKTQNEITQENNKTFSLIESKMSFLEQNNDFKQFNSSFENKKIENTNIASLKPEVYNAYLRYDSNKEPLAKALGKVEIYKAHSELQASLKASSNMPYAPQNMDVSKLYAQNQYEEKIQKIVEKYIPIADRFVGLLNSTDVGKTIISNTVNSNFEDKLKKDINKNIGNNENSETELSSKIEINTKLLIGKISTLQQELNKEIKNFKNGSQENLKQRDYITREKILYQDLPKRFETLISKEINTYAKNIGKELVSNNASVVGEQKVFNLPIGGNKEVVLDFGELGNTKGKSMDELLKLYEKNFDDIYKNSLSSKIYRELTSKKGLIDVSGIVISGAVAVKFSTDTLGSGIPASALIFTASENAFRAGMYELFDVEGGWQAGTGIDLENDKASDIFRKKGFELVSNGVLFGLFRASGWGKEKILQHISKPDFAESLSGKMATYGIKTGTEATFFTYYTIATNNLQENIKNGGNTKEMLESFTNVGNINDFMKLFAYNMGFITLAKGGGKIAEKGEVLVLQKNINKELQVLQEKGYFLVGAEFYKGNNKVQSLPADFHTLSDLNKKLGYLATDTYRKPDSGRAGKSINTNQVDPAKRYEKLEKYSKQTVDGKISYALGDKTIGETIQTNGLNSGKGVGEGLLKKSGFNNDEISQFKKGELKGEKPVEVKALSEMDKAMEVVYREYKDGLNKYILGIPLEKAYPNLSKELLPKLNTIINKDLDIIIPKKKENI